MAARGVAVRNWARSISRLVLRLVLVLLVLGTLTAAVLWVAGPHFMSPAVPFDQGAGGAAAYLSMFIQLRRQQEAFWQGEPVELAISESEFDGLLASALLSGHKPADLIQKVRTGLHPNEIQIESVLRLSYPKLPHRYRGPVGLKLRLKPTVKDSRSVQLQITQATIGRLPVPLRLLTWAGERFAGRLPGLNLAEPSFTVPLSDLIRQQLGKRVDIHELSTDGERIRLRFSLVYE